jgi:DNA replication protein DnaC
MTRKMLTHITTNLNSSEIEEIYGTRVRSRLREQFNLIAFSESAKDKRK